MNKTSDLITEMIVYFSGDTRRINHFLKVYAFAKAIGEKENLDNIKQEILEVAAIVHDIGTKVSLEKYNSSAPNYQQFEGPPIAEQLLKRLGYEDSIIDRVKFLIGYHHTYHAIDDIDFQVLVEADLIVNIYEKEMPKESIIQIKNDVFSTKTGISYLNHLYLK